MNPPDDFVALAERFYQACEALRAAARTYAPLDLTGDSNARAKAWHALCEAAKHLVVAGINFDDAIKQQYHPPTPSKGAIH